MNWNEIKVDLKKKLTSKRYQHTMNVIEVAEELALRYKCSVEKASLAALLHDCAKCFSNDELIDYAKQYHIKTDMVSLLDPQLLHGPVGAVVATEIYGVEDEEIQNAIHFHTTGRKGMTELDKIIYLADFIEKGRSFSGVDAIRKTAFIDLDKATIQALTNSICHVAQMGSLIHKNSVYARNELIIREIEKIKKERE